MRLRFAAARLLALLRKRRLEGELDGEIRAHLEMAELDAISAGLPPEEARHAARRGFGGIEQMKQNHRDQRSVRWVENLLRDARYGLASLARDPGFAAVTIGLLALGIGANTAMFSIVDAVLLKPLPFPEPERMVRVWETPAPAERNGTTTLTFFDWKRQSDIFEALSVESSVTAAVSAGDYPERIKGAQVSAGYFQVFGVKPQIGRTFAPGEDQPGAGRVVVVSHAFWQTRLGGDPGVLKRDLNLDGGTAPDHRGFAGGQFRPRPSWVLGALDFRAGSNESRAALAEPRRAAPRRREPGAGAGKDEHPESQS